MLDFEGHAIVLIETLWNVKQTKEMERYYAQLGINRNIVECKVVPASCPALALRVLIETLWNVKTDNMLVKAQALEY